MKVILAVFQRFGFTRNEIKAILFLSLAFLGGLVLRQFRTAQYATNAPPDFDYSELDSIFLARSNAARVTVPSAAPERESRERSSAAAPLLSGGIELNSATKSDLMRLPGIGATYADRILRYREERGPFRSVDDLEKIKGIGKKTVERLRDYIRVDTPR